MNYRLKLINGFYIFMAPVQKMGYE